MVFWVSCAIIGVLVLLIIAWGWRASWRLRVNRSIILERERLLQGHNPGLRPREDQPVLLETFRKDYLIRAEGFLDDSTLKTFRQECSDNMPRIVRGFVPTHKQGGTLSYETLHHHAVNCLSLYHSERMLNWVSDIVGVRVYPAGDHDQSACSILYYTQEGDYINWHVDPNFYHGRQFTVLIVLINRSENGGLSASNLMRKRPDGGEEVVFAGENDLVLFEGTRIWHKVSPVKAGDVRVILSMTFNTDRKISLFWELARRAKDTAFYGLRVLWD
jgi:2OG-Fe(II) oxygenase superfamily